MSDWMAEPPDRHGDPASLSALGGALRTRSLELDALLERLRPTSRGGAAQAGRRDPGTDALAGLVAELSTELDRAGAALQAWATDLAADGSRRRELSARAHAFGLDVRHGRVVEPPGPSRVDPADRLAARSDVQELLNRVSARDGRGRADLARLLEASAAALAGTAARARDGLGAAPSGRPAARAARVPGGRPESRGGLP